jgi:hypothetical protein
MINRSNAGLKKERSLESFYRVAQWEKSDYELNQGLLLVQFLMYALHMKSCWERN